MSNQIIPLTPLYDRSRVVADWTCPRKRYYGYEYQGKGIVKNSSSLELFTGTVVHDALATIAALRNEPLFSIDILAQDAYNTMYDELMRATAGETEADSFSKEQATLVEGLIRGFYKHVWPRLLNYYPEILFIEKEMTYSHGGLTFMSKGDLIVRDGEEVVYIEYKTTKSKREDWVNSWDTAVQLHSTCKAVEQTTGIKIDKVIVQGLYKGYEAYGKQTSPFCYAYKKWGNPPFTTDQLSYEYKQGAKKFPVWELEGGCKKWVEDMPETLLADQFPQTPPIFINDELVEAFFRQRETREHEIAFFNRSDTDKEMMLDNTFPQKFDQCVPGYGRPCEFKKLCHGPKTDPLKEGFVWRTPHHSTEAERWKTEHPDV